MLYPVVGAALGSWTGAFPIPLDWERPWQVHPILAFSIACG
jgi:GPI ethanolamine phosphate transferase 2/3 subunit F